jgi:hypothetical protein
MEEAIYASDLFPKQAFIDAGEVAAILAGIFVPSAPSDIFRVRLFRWLFGGLMGDSAEKNKDRLLLHA